MKLIRLLFEALALVTSLMNAFGVTFIARGMKGTKPIVAAFYSVAIQTVILILLLLTQIHQLNVLALSYFAIGGVLSLGVARLLNFIAIRGLGVAKTSALIGSSPVITSLLSIAILSEGLDMITIVGAITVAFGIALISGASGFKIEKALFIGLASALAYSLSNIVNKMGIQVQPDPFLSASVSAISGLIFTSVYIIASEQGRDLKINKQSLIYFSLTGILSSVGWLSMMKALETGSVGVVTTIVYSYPLFSLITTRFLMRDEKLNKRTVTGSILVVIGVTIVILL